MIPVKQGGSEECNQADAYLDFLTLSFRFDDSKE